MLAFEREMFLDAMSSDGLMVAAKGLGVEQVFASLLSVYSDPGNLVLVMGVNEAEEEHFMRTLQSDDDVKLPPKKITSEYSAAERQKLYLGGGVLFVTTRILVVDLLTDRIPANLVTGILVYRAHKTAESCQESFVLRLFRQKNDKGFIKAFSAAPVSFRSGFCQVSRVMRNLFLRHLYLWPRFHASINDSLSDSTPQVIEMQIEMTKVNESCNPRLA